MIRFLIITLVAMLLASCSDEPASEKPVAAAPVAEEPKAAETTDEAIDAAPIAETPADPTGIDKSNPRWRQQLEMPEMMDFAPGESVYWDMETNVGAMSFLLYSDTAPMHVTSTIYLTELGFYDSLIFHRVISGFMAQGGDPTGTGRSGPGYQYDGEFTGGRSHDRPGLLSMANAGAGTDGSQFFITFVPTLWLDGKHTLFGEIVSGHEVLKALEERGSGSGKTSEKLEIIKATIRRESSAG
jgi:peptidyl-prolyl cis-trans isomerase B (cyclophilin B)